MLFAGAVRCLTYRGAHCQARKGPEKVLCAGTRPRDPCLHTIFLRASRHAAVPRTVPRGGVGAGAQRAYVRDPGREGRVRAGKANRSSETEEPRQFVADFVHRVHVEIKKERKRRPSNSSVA